MFYLPPASWWRFIGWLVLGMAVYFAYGYSHSVVGREAGRPARPALGQRLAAFGFLLAGVGLFVIPHDAGLGELLREAGERGERRPRRAPCTGCSLIVGGILAAVAGLLMGRRERAGTRTERRRRA